MSFCSAIDNGGDGLVAARHLSHFGYKPVVVYPKRPKNDLYERLVVQCESLSIPVLESLPKELPPQFDAILDAIFGFSFKGGMRAPFDTICDDLNASKLPIFSVDVPSGWNVEEGDTTGKGLKAEALISLTAPKLCAKKFDGKFHYLGGRFVPPAIREKYNLQIPSYPGSSQFVLLSGL